MLDHGQGLVGVGAGDDSHVAVAFAHRRLINQKHRAAAAAAMLSDQPRPGPHQRVDDRPAHTVAARHPTDRHHLRVRQVTTISPGLSSGAVSTLAAGWGRPPVAWAGTATRGHLVGLWWRPQGQPLPHQLAEPSTLILYVPMLARPACSLTVASM